MALHLNIEMNVSVLQERGVKVKVKVKFALEQAAKAQRRRRGVALLNF